MGQDACIYFKTRDGGDPLLCDPLPSECRVERAASWIDFGATHEVVQLWRYYAPGYERGPWPRIAAALLALLACPNVEAVWYFGDAVDEAPPFDRSQVLSYSEHYMAVGDRPYRGL